VQLGTCSIGSSSGLSGVEALATLPGQFCCALWSTNPNACLAVFLLCSTTGCHLPRREPHHQPRQEVQVPCRHPVQPPGVCQDGTNNQHLLRGKLTVALTTLLVWLPAAPIQQLAIFSSLPFHPVRQLFGVSPMLFVLCCAVPVLCRLPPARTSCQ
jgi:hypothetical protein